MTRMSEIPPAVRVYVKSLLVRMDGMQVELDELKAQVKRLTPQNSSVPPSTVHPHARPPAKPKSRSKKKRGGQQGHPRKVRELVPVGERPVNRMVQFTVAFVC